MNDTDAIQDALTSAATALAAPLPPLADTAEAAALVDVAFATHDSPAGELLLAATPRGLVKLAYLDSEEGEQVLERLARTISPRVLRAPRRLDGVRRELEEYFARHRRNFDVPIDWQLVHGFGRRVLEVTAQIPYGSVSTYKEVAAEAGSPRGSRAAGNALGSNPLPIVVPCHRVLRSGGGLGGYTGGLDRKRLLLSVEGRA